jgi:16S rRNA processing protein RimM
MSGDILLGVVIGAQGLSGEVKVKTFTAAIENLRGYGPLYAQGGREFIVASARHAKADIAVVRFKGVDDRNAAEALKGTELRVARDALPPTEDDEFYHADLVGLRAEDAEGRALGTVKGIHNFGAGDVIEIERADGGDIFLPFTRETVPTVDLKSSRIVIAVQEDEAAEEEHGVE